MFGFRHMPSNNAHQSTTIQPKKPTTKIFTLKLEQFCTIYNILKLNWKQYIGIASLLAYIFIYFMPTEVITGTK